MKLKVLERCTGHKKVEEWMFLPKNWNYHLDFWGYRTIIFEKNFALLKFDTLDNPSRDDILILNLVTRKSFWMRTTTIETQVKEKAAGQVDLGNFLASRTRVYGMEVENDRLLIFYDVIMTNLRDKRATIG